jgi:hypothetical protein
MAIKTHMQIKKNQFIKKQNSNKIAKTCNPRYKKFDLPPSPNCSAL